MRKRLQRIRDRLRKEIEMSEQQNVRDESIGNNLPRKIVELLARPRLTQLPENPVGRMWNMIRAELADYEEVADLPEMVQDAAVAAAFGGALGSELKAIISRDSSQRVDATRFLRTDLTLPLVLSLKGRGGPLRLTSAGKTYRVGPPDRTHLEAFHQCEIFLLQERLCEWDVLDVLSGIMKKLLPGKRLKLEEGSHPLCTRIWTLFVEVNGQWISVAGWGNYVDQIVEYIGCDPERFGAAGAGLGLERLASIHFGINDLRTIEAAKV
jgi:phenylalanyl-tRNA synthetase alpha subunit